MDTLKLRTARAARTTAGSASQSLFFPIVFLRWPPSGSTSWSCHSISGANNICSMLMWRASVAPRFLFLLRNLMSCLQDHTTDVLSLLFYAAMNWRNSQGELGIKPQPSEEVSEQRHTSLKLQTETTQLLHRRPKLFLRPLAIAADDEIIISLSSYWNTYFHKGLKFAPVPLCTTMECFSLSSNKLALTEPRHMHVRPSWCSSSHLSPSIWVFFPLLPPRLR